MKILAAARDNAANYYRIQSPFSVLRQRGYDVEVTQPTFESHKTYDVLWLQMHTDPMADILIRSFKDAGKLVVYDVDDWVFEVPPSWNSYHHYFEAGTGRPGERIRFLERAMVMADLVTCTTPYLAEKLRTKTKTPVKVVPNCVMMGDWDTLLESYHEQDGPVLGWFGTFNHWDDWREIVGAVDRALDAVHGYLALIGAPEMLVGFPERLIDRTLIVPAVPMVKFHELRPLIAACDVGLAWATDTLEISKCRSPLKALQWGAAGVPLIASTTVYSDVLKDTFVVPTTLANLEARLVETLTMAEYPKQALAKTWQERVFERHSYETQSSRWLEAIDDLL